MTARGTLAYYLAAWVVGAFVLAALLLSTDLPALSASGFLRVYFVTLFFALFELLLFAFCLRRTAHALKADSLWNWMILGAGLFAVIEVCLGWIAGREIDPVSYQRWLFDAMFYFAAYMKESGLWQAPIDGAAIGALLFVVDAAFRPTEENVGAQ